MAIEFLINHACRVKAELGPEGMVQLVKSRSRAGMLLDRFMRDGMGRDEAMQATFGMQVRLPDGNEELRRVSVGSMLQAASILDDHSQACSECPVAMGRPFGCFQSIHYPISEAAEEWLASMAVEALAKGMPNSILLKFILDENLTGQGFKSLRADEDTRYLSSSLPIELEIEDPEWGNAVVDTDQLLEAFFGVGTLGEVHQQLLLLFSGGLTLRDSPPALERIGVQLQCAPHTSQDGSVRFWVYTMPDTLQDDASIKQIKAFLRSVFAAFGCKAEIKVEG